MDTGQVVERFGATDGCSAIPNSWLNEEVDFSMFQFIDQKYIKLNEEVTLDNTCTADSHS